MDSDRVRIGELFGAHSAALRQYAVRRVSPEVDPDDVVAEVFAVAWRRIADVPPGPDARPYLFTIARLAVANAERSARRSRRLTLRAVELAEPEEGIGPDADDPGERVRQAVGQLRTRDREALVLVLWDGLSHAEAAQALGCSTAALTARLARARTRLRRLLADLSGTPSAASDLGRQQ